MHGVQPLTANIINAFMCTFMSFGLLFTPQKFMQGGQYQSPWFKNLPANRNHRLYYLGQFMGFLMLGGCVIPTLFQPDSQFLCYQMCIVHGLNLIHSLIFICSSIYKRASPDLPTSRRQWGLMIILNIVFFLITLIASLHPVPDVVNSKETYVSKFAANIAMLLFSSVFGILFLVVPKHLMSLFWTDQDQQEDEKVCGFQLLNISDHELWWSRCSGCVIIALNLGVAIDLNVEQPLYTIGSLVILSSLTLHNIHQVIMRPYLFITRYQILVSWIPNILMSLGMCSVLVCAVLYI